MSYKSPKKIERHILIVETPEGHTPSRGDLENCIFDMDQATSWNLVTLEHPGTTSEDCSKIVMHEGKWKRGKEYIYGPETQREKVIQNTVMINAMREAIKVLCVECAKITGCSHEVLEA